MITEQIAYRKGDVWLCRYNVDLRPLTIKQIAGNFIEHTYGWDTVQNFHCMAEVKIGTARTFLGIKFGIKRV
jgi:hypothetical protein